MSSAPFGFGAPFASDAERDKAAFRPALVPLALGASLYRDGIANVVGMARSAADTLGYFGDVARGRKSTFDSETGRTSDEAIQKGFDAAGLAMTGSAGVPVPKGALRTFGGPNALGADRSGLLETTVREAAGGPGNGRTGIYRDTGWFTGKDGQPRFEISDRDMSLREPTASGTMTVGSVVDHPELFRHYPELRDINVLPTQDRNTLAYANRHENTIGLNFGDPGARTNMLHELQHFIQAKEGFTVGMNPADPRILTSPEVQGPRFAHEHALSRGDAADAARAGHDAKLAAHDLYTRSAGEVEARNVQARADFDEVGRRRVPPWSTEDVPDHRQWVPGGSDLYSGGPGGAGGASAALATPRPADAAPATKESPMTAGLGFPPGAPGVDLSRLFDPRAMGAPQSFAGTSGTVVPQPPFAADEAQTQALERQMGMVPEAAPAPRTAGLGFPAVPPAPTPKADAPAPGAVPAIAAAAPAQPASTPVGSNGDDFSAAMARFRDRGGFDYLGAIGAGLLSSPTMAGGVANGLQLAQRGETQRAASDLAKTELALKRAKLAKEERGQNATRDYLVRKGFDDGLATAAMDNPTVLQSVLSQLNKDPSRVSIGGNIYELKPGERPNPSNLLGPAEAERDQQKLVDVPLGNGQTQKAWLKPGESTGQPVGQPERSGSSNVTAQVEERRQAVIAQGGDPMDARYLDYILTGKLPREDQQSLTPADKNAIREGQDRARSALIAVQQLKAARGLSDKAYDGATATQRAWIASNNPNFLGGASQSALDTMEMQQLIDTQALTSMKSIFGANPTEGERAALSKMQGSANHPLALRNDILDEAIRQAESRAQYEQETVDQLRGGTFYRPEQRGGPGAVQGPGPGYTPPAAQKPAPTQAPPGGYHQPKSRADYDSLPSGAKYIAPDGSVRMKP